MTGFDYDYAQAVNADRIRRAADKRQRAQLRTANGTDHRVRRQVAEMFISLGLRLAPQPLEPVRRPHTTPC